MATKRTPGWLVERIALGELPADELQRRRVALLAEPDGAERLAAIEASNQEILATYPPAREVAAIRMRAEQQAPSRGRLWFGGLGALSLAGAAALLLVLQPAEPGEGSDRGSQLQIAQGEMGSERTKGDLSPRLLLYRSVGEGSEPLAEGARATKGDLLRLGYIAAGAQHGVLLSIDGRGEVSLHFPETPESSTLLDSAGEVLLPHAYELDDAPQYERFFFVTSAAPLRVSDLQAAAKRLAADREGAVSKPLLLPETLQQTSLTVTKESP